MKDDSVSRREYMHGFAGAAMLPLSVYVEPFNGFFRSLPDEINQYGSNRLPGWIVEYSDDEDALTALTDWTDSDSRSLLKTDEDSNTALITASMDDVVSGWFGGSSVLSNLGYVERVSLDVSMDVPEPVGSLSSEGEIDLPSDWWIRGSFDQSSVAYANSINGGTLGEVRGVLQVDDVPETGDGVVVSVLDDGVDADESLYGDRIISARNFITEEDGIENCESESGHGSWVASSIAADPDESEYRGIAPSVELLVGKVLGSSGGSAFDVANAIRWSAREGADLINLSLGSVMYSPEIVVALEYALENGVSAVFVATGNSRDTTRWINSPADSLMDGVVPVGATTLDLPNEAKSAYFSSVGEDPGWTNHSMGKTRGAKPLLGAPGCEIESATGVETGTSMASPIVCGVYALALEHHSWDTEDVMQSLDYAEPISSAGVTEVGHGMPVASNVLNEIEPDESQEEVREPSAEARDTANASLASWDARWDSVRHRIGL